LDPEAEDLGLERRQGSIQSAFNRMLLRPYFSRMWVIQEITLEKQLEMRCGHESLLYDDLLDAQELMSSHSGGDNDRIPFPTPSFFYMSHVRRGLQWGLTTSLMVLIHDYRGIQATDARDKVYAISGLSSESG
jgi:hypothetical protein